MTEYTHRKALAELTEVTDRAAQIAAVLPSADEHWAKAFHLLRNLAVHQCWGGKSTSILLEEVFVQTQAGEQSFDSLRGVFEAGLEELATIEKDRELAATVIAEFLALAVLTERSSLGTPPARRLRRSTSDADLAKIMCRTDQGKAGRRGPFAGTATPSVLDWVAADSDPSVQEADCGSHGRRQLGPLREDRVTASVIGASEKPGTLKGVVFWPVATGYSTTVVVDDEHVLQIDLHDEVAVGEQTAVNAPVTGRLADVLPKRDGAPYLSVFALTHADEDHCRGFGTLLDSEIVIGELWATPRLWHELAKDDPPICPHTRRFRTEAKRRLEAALDHIAAGRPVPSGDRIRVIGNAADQASDPSEPGYGYAVLPEELVSFPGDVISTMDGDDVGDKFAAALPAPFMGDCAAARNDTSLALQITLFEGGTTGRILLLGDLGYATIDRILRAGEDDAIAWDVLLAPHHCIKKVMYAPDANAEEGFKRDMMDALETAASQGACIVASSQPILSTANPGEGPPHAAGKQHCQEIITAGHFRCAQKHGGEEDPQPIVFALGSGGLALAAAADGDGDGAATRLAKVAASACPPRGES